MEKSHFAVSRFSLPFHFIPFHKLERRRKREERKGFWSVQEYSILWGIFLYPLLLCNFFFFNKFDIIRWIELDQIGLNRPKKTNMDQCGLNSFCSFFFFSFILLMSHLSFWFVFIFFVFNRYSNVKD